MWIYAQLQLISKKSILKASEELGKHVDEPNAHLYFLLESPFQIIETLLSQSWLIFVLILKPCLKL